MWHACVLTLGRLEAFLHIPAPLGSNRRTEALSHCVGVQAFTGFRLNTGI